MRKSLKFSTEVIERAVRKVFAAKYQYLWQLTVSGARVDRRQVWLDGRVVVNQGT